MTIYTIFGSPISHPNFEYVLSPNTPNHHQYTWGSKRASMTDRAIFRHLVADDIVLFAFNITSNDPVEGFPKIMSHSTIGNLYITRVTHEYYDELERAQHANENPIVIWDPNNGNIFPHRFKFQLLYGPIPFNAMRPENDSLLNSLQTAVARSADGYIKEWNTPDALQGLVGIELQNALFRHFGINLQDQEPQIPEAIDEPPPVEQVGDYVQEPNELDEYPEPQNEHVIQPEDNNPAADEVTLVNAHDLTITNSHRHPDAINLG